MKTSKYKSVLTLIISVMSIVFCNGQTIDTLQFDNSTYIMFNKVEFEKIYRPDTCITDPSGAYIFYIYKNVEYYGMTKAELIKILNKRTLPSPRSNMLLDPKKNILWGYRTHYSTIISEEIIKKE